MSKSYDPCCYELAESFLDDHCVRDHETIDLLAQAIQGTIEDFIDALPRPLEVPHE